MEGLVVKGSFVSNYTLYPKPYTLRSDRGRAS